MLEPLTAGEGKHCETLDSNAGHLQYDSNNTSLLAVVMLRSATTMHIRGLSVLEIQSVLMHQ